MNEPKTNKRRRFTYTYDDISAMVGLAPRTVKNHARKKLFDPNSLQSTFNYISKVRKGVQSVFDSTI